MANGTDSEEFVLLSQVRMGHKCEFAFAMKAQSEICVSLGRTLATQRYRESEGEKKKKKPCTTREILTADHRHPLLSFSGSFFSLSLSLSMCFCCFDSVLKLSWDFGISFPCVREFAEYSRYVLRVKALTLNARDSRVLL